jgi:hypothetical protein
MDSARKRCSDIIDRPARCLSRQTVLTAESISPRSVSDSRSCWRAICPTIDLSIARHSTS